MNPRKRYKRSCSALRILLNYPQLSKGIEQFKRVEFRGTEYIYNTFTGNIIATYRETSRGTLIRYRSSSHYAHVITSYGEKLRGKQITPVHILPSYQLSHMQRRIRRWSQEIGTVKLELMTLPLGTLLGKSRVFNALTTQHGALHTEPQSFTVSSSISINEAARLTWDYYPMPLHEIQDFNIEETRPPTNG